MVKINIEWGRPGNGDINGISCQKLQLTLDEVGKREIEAWVRLFEVLFNTKLDVMVILGWEWAEDGKIDVKSGCGSWINTKDGFLEVKITASVWWEEESCEFNI